MASLEEVLAQINGSGPDLTTPEDVIQGQAGSVGGPDLPRGIRNNNPGNIRRSAIPWEGKVEGTDTAFETFATPEHGMRALEKNLTTYQTKHGLDTPRKIIGRWAPPTENDTGAYVNAVAQALGVGPDDPINVQDPAVMQRLRDAIIQHENGQNPYAGGAAAPTAAPASPGVDVAGARQRAIGTRETMESARDSIGTSEDYNTLLQGAAGLLKGAAPGGSVSAGDYGKSAVASLGSLGSMLAGAGEYASQQLGAGEGTGNEAWRSLSPMFAAMRETTDAFTQEWLDKRSDEAKERAARQFTTLDPDQTIWQGGMGEFVSSIALKGAESLAPTIVPLGGAALLGRLSVVAASTVLGGSEAVLSMGAAAADMADAVREAPIEELMSSPQFQTRLKEAGGNEVAAREAFINDVQGWSPIITGAIVGLTAKIVGRSFDEIFSPDKGLGLFKRTGVGFTSEATQEAGQSAAEQVAQNVARRVYNSDTGVWDGVLEASLQGAAVGGPMGGGMAAAFGTRPQPVKPKEQAVPDDIAAAVNPVPVGAPTVPDTTAIPVPNVDPTGTMNAPEQEGMFAGIGPQTWTDMGGGEPPPPPSGGGPGTPGMSFGNEQVARAIDTAPLSAIQGTEPPPRAGQYPGFAANIPGPQDPFDTTGMETVEPPPPPMPPNAGPQLDPDTLPFVPPEAPAQGEPPVPYQPAQEDQVLLEGQPPDKTSRQQVGWRVRRLDRQGNVIASKLMGKEEAANGMAEVWRKESEAKGTGDTIEVLPARQTVLGDRSPEAESVGDYMAQLDDLQSEDRRGVYISKKGLAHLKAVGKLDEVLGRGVPIRNFDNLGGIMVAKGGAAARELIELKETDAGSLDEIIGYATTAGRGKPVGKDSLVAQKVDEDLNVVRERLISPAEKQQVIEEWGEDVRFVRPEKALADRKARVAADRKPVQSQDVAQSKEKVGELFTGPVIGGDKARAEALVEQDPDITEDEVGEKLIQSAAVTAKAERERRKFGDLPAPEDVYFRGKEVTQAARTAQSAGKTKAELEAQKAELEATPLSPLEDAKTRQETLTRISDAIYEANRDVQKAAGTVTGTKDVAAQRQQEYRDLYGKLVDAAIRVEIQQDMGSDQDATEAQAAYDQALEDIKLFMQVEGAYTRGEALADAAMRFSPKARKKVFARTQAAKENKRDLTAVEKAVEQGFRARPDEVTTDEMSPKEARAAGKLRNTGEQVVSDTVSAENVARAARVSALSAAELGKVKLHTKRLEAAAKKLEGMLTDPETRYLVRRWLGEYMLAMRRNTPAEQRNVKTNRNWAWHGRAGRVTEMVGNLFGENVTAATQQKGLENVATRVVKLASRANRLGIGAEMDPTGFILAIESGKASELEAFLTEQVTPLEDTGFPSDLTKDALEAMDPGTLNTLYVRAVNFMDAERTPDVVRAFMVRGVKKWLGRRFSTGEVNVNEDRNVRTGEKAVPATFKERDAKGNVTKEWEPAPRFVSARQLYNELISGSSSMQGTGGDKRMPLDQLKELYALAVEESKSAAKAKDRLPERPMGLYRNKLLRRVAKSDKVEDILRASAKAGKQKVGTGGTQLTRTTTDKATPDKYTKAESKYSPGVLLNNDPPRELKGKAKEEHEAKQRQAISEMAREDVAFDEFLTKLEKNRDFAAIASEVDGKGRMTERARLARNAQTYATWLSLYLGSFVKLNEAQQLQNPKVLDEVLQLVEDLRNIRNLPMKNFITQLGGAFGVEMAAQEKRARGAINNALDKRNPQDKGQWMAASLARLGATEAALDRLNEQWKNSEEYVEIIQPILANIRKALIRDKWYSYELTDDEQDAVSWLFAKWSRNEEWMNRLTKKQREAIEKLPFDQTLKDELYDPLSKQLAATGFPNRDVALEKKFVKRFGKDAGTPRERVLEGDVVYRLDADGNRIPTITGKEVGGAWALPDDPNTPENQLADRIREASLPPEQRARAREEALVNMTDEEADKLPAGRKEERQRLLTESKATRYAAQLQKVQDLMQEFRDYVSGNLRNVTAAAINAAESRMIEALRDLGAWKDISKKDGTGTIKLPDAESVMRQIEKLTADMRALEAEYGYHRVAVRDSKGKPTGETKLLFIGGERTDAKGRLVGQDPKYLKQWDKLAEEMNDAQAQLALLPRGPKFKTEAITYRRLGDRLVQGLVTKAQVAENAAVLKLRRFMTEIERQLTLGLPKTPQPRKSAWKGLPLDENDKPLDPPRKLTEKEELARAKAEARESLANQQEPLPFEVAQAVNRLSGKLNLDLTAMSGDAAAPTANESEAYSAITTALANAPEGATMGDVVADLQSSLERDHPYQPLLAKLARFPEIAATNVRFVELIPGTKGNGVGRLVLDSENKPRIILSRKWFGANGLNPVEGLHALLHEMVHAATVGNIIGPMYGNRELRNRIDTLRKIAREKFGDRFDYATSDVYEFVAEAYTNAEFQRALKDYKAAELAKSSLWNRFVNIVRTFMGLDTEFTDLLDAVMTITTDTFGPTPFDKYSKRVVDLEGAGLNLGVDTFLDKHVTPVTNALKDRAKLRADMVREGTTALNRLAEAGRRFMVKSLTVRQLHDFFVNEFGGKDGALAKWFAAWEARNASATHELGVADKLSRRWTLLRDADPEAEVRLSEVMHDATTYGMHIDEAFPSAAAFQAKANLAALKASKARKAYEEAKVVFDATYGKQPNIHLEESQRGDYDKIRAEWDKLTPEAQALYKEVRNYYRETIDRESRLMMLNAIRSSKLYDGEFTLTENDIDFEKINEGEGGINGWLQRTLGIDIAADKKAIEKLKESLKTDSATLTKDQIRARKQALRLTQIDLAEEIDQLRIVAKMASIPRLKKGPYFPKRRFGDYVVRAEKLIEVKRFANRPEANAWKHEQQLKDPTIQFKEKRHEDGTMDVAAIEVEFRTGETYTEAANAREELIRIYGKDAVTDIDTKSNQFARDASIPSNAALQALLGKLEGNPGAQAALRNFYLQTLSDKSFRKNEIKRKNIRGADAANQQRAFAFYAKSSSYYTAQLRYGHVMATAKREMDEFVKKNREQPGDRHSTIMLRKLVDELEIRDNQAADIHDLPKFIRRSVEYGQFMLLTSPSYWLINATQPWMVTVPWLAGYTSTLNAVNELKKAQNLIIHPLLKESVKSYGGFKALWSKTTAEDAFTVVEKVVDDIAKSDHPRKADLLRMIESLKQASIIDLSFVAELRQIAVGEDSKMADAVLDASRIMAHLTEVNNRLMVSIAAYEIYRKQGQSHEDAVQFAKQAVAKTQFDYSAQNKPRLFSANDAAWKPLVFQFMQYAQHMYVTMFEQVAKLVRNENFGDRKRAARILGGMLGTHMIAGGIVGMTIQPIKWAFGLLMVAFGDDDEDNTFRNAVSGETYDRAIADALAAIFGTNKVSEVLRAGAPRALGFDVSNRMALGQLYMADINPKNAETLAGSIAMSFLGPMPNLVGNLYQASQKFAEGDLDRAAELASPKMIRDVIRAYRFANEGVTDNTGKVIMTPSQLDPVSLFWQSMGFSPSQVAELYARNSAVKDRQMFANTRKAEVMKMQRMVRVTGNYRDAQQALREYNRQFPENPITFAEVVRSLTGQREDERTVQRLGATLGERERAYAREGKPYNVE
jgi:hypothetical protein